MAQNKLQITSNCIHIFASADAYVYHNNYFQTVGILKVFCTE